MEGTKHQSKLKGLSTNSTLVSFYGDQKRTHERSVISAEIMMAQFIAMHNLPFEAGDHLSTLDLLQQIYPVPFNKQQVKLKMREFIIDGEIDPTISDAVQFWLQVLAMKSPMDEQKYLYMAILSLQLLSIPASNADSGRVFSVVRRIKTEFRSSLSTESVFSLNQLPFQ